jgi:Uma2 family endonuclease
VTAETIDSSWMLEPITAEQYDAMPEEQCRNIEIVEGMVHVSPKPTRFHNRVARRIADGIDVAGRPAWTTDLDNELRLRDIPLLNRAPDVIVCRTETPLRGRFPLDMVLAVVEVVSPGSEMTDRVVKPLEYAEAGIQYYWRVETADDVPIVHTFKLDPASRVYRSTGVHEETIKSDLGFPVEIDLTDI